MVNGKKSLKNNCKIGKKKLKERGLHKPRLLEFKKRTGLSPKKKEK